ncbi:hypothetical protein HMN09_00039100 [Mycena chlorophos]|uniref:Uncharacterized protein n=1 Tax=Mycena chlorophos TaxID=658473 RepID=A0A8H6WMG7_MYCCL|nr:hypothetical protein HMN09_00039100 [Mycena chlorophos]
MFVATKTIIFALLAVTAVLAAPTPDSPNVALHNMPDTNAERLQHGLPLKPARRAHARRATTSPVARAYVPPAVAASADCP